MRPIGALQSKKKGVYSQEKNALSSKNAEFLESTQLFGTKKILLICDKKGTFVPNFKMYKFYSRKKN